MKKLTCCFCFLFFSCCFLSFGCLLLLFLRVALRCLFLVFLVFLVSYLLFLILLLARLGEASFHKTLVGSQRCLAA
jgi:hypothetical protein